MSIKKYWGRIVVGVVVIVGVSATVAVMALPAPTACMAIGVYEFEELSERFLVPPNSSAAQKSEYKALIREARERIRHTFGEPEADPTVVFFDDPRAFAPLFLNEVGQAPGIGNRVCLIIGPRGQNIDVVSHELMHSELLHRVGAWKMFREIPAWFDEGAAMQVDFRKRFMMPPERLADTSYVRKLKSYDAFFSGKYSYPAARREVMELLDKQPANSFFVNLERIRNGESFAQVFE
jgi:hypothetical protein